MRKTINIAKQTLTVQCEAEEIAQIDEAVSLLNRRIVEIGQEIGNHDQAILMSSLDLLVHQLKTNTEIQAQNQQYQQQLKQYQHTSSTLNQRLSKLLNNDYS